MASIAAGVAVVLALLALFSAATGVTGVGFEFHHRFSDRVRQWATERAIPGTRWPEKGTVDYYTTLVHHDRALLGRSLVEADNSTELAFAGGNITVKLSSLGFLHYAVVELGTPNVSFVVAMDTGSDLFWVPCDCQQCAPTSSPDYGLNIVFNIYSPSNSSTSQKVTCRDSLCEQSNACLKANSSCPYSVQYLSANTSSSGILVEDILYLKTEDSIPKLVKAPIVFGCGEIQTGSFLSNAAPNGLFGLGRDKTSVPSVLSAKGFTSNSFSMCFGDDGIGRINLGDNGTSDQQETAFVARGLQTLYGINITSIVVGSDNFGQSFNVLIDSGTSFTILSDPMYTNISESFNKQVHEKRHGPISDLPFDYCYDLSPTQKSILLPEINLTTNGGAIFPVNDPIVVVDLQGGTVYCLAIIQSRGINIIGQNFLTGLRVVFDREREVLGWKNFDCYKTDDTSDLPVNNSSTTPPAASPSSLTPPETSNTTQIPVTKPSSSSGTGNLPHFNPVASLSILLLLLHLAII